MENIGVDQTAGIDDAVRLPQEAGAPDGDQVRAAAAGANKMDHSAPPCVNECERLLFLRGQDSTGYAGFCKKKTPSPGGESVPAYRTVTQSLHLRALVKMPPGNLARAQRAHTVEVRLRRHPTGLPPCAASLPMKLWSIIMII